MWVLRREPKEMSRHDQLSPWKGCLHVDLNDKAWYATSLAKPTQFASPSKAERCREIVKDQFPESTIEIAIYEEIFQKPLPISTTQSVTLAKNNVPDWSWNDDIPF